MIDNENYRAERQKRNRELVCRIKADVEKKYDKYWYEFQVTGNSSTERTARKYEELITICELALRGIDEECGRCRMRRKNGVELDDLYDLEYTDYVDKEFIEEGLKRVPTVQPEQRIQNRGKRVYDRK